MCAPSRCIAGARSDLQTVTLNRKTLTRHRRGDSQSVPPSEPESRSIMVANGGAVTLVNCKGNAAAVPVQVNLRFARCVTRTGDDFRCIAGDDSKPIGRDANADKRCFVANGEGAVRGGYRKIHEADPKEVRVHVVRRHGSREAFVVIEYVA